MIATQQSVPNNRIQEKVDLTVDSLQVAAIGPDAENYEQTLSTLRYGE